MVKLKFGEKDDGILADSALEEGEIYEGKVGTDRCLFFVTGANIFRISENGNTGYDPRPSALYELIRKITHKVKITVEE